MDDERLFRALKRAADPAELAAVDAWRRASGENERRYQELSRLLVLTSRAEVDRTSIPLPRAADLLATPRPLAVPVRPGWIRRWWIGAAAVLVAAAGMALWAARRPARAARFGVDELVTGAAETATVTLTDGSVVRLAPKSRFRVDDRTEGRAVSLRGRAYFAVAPRRDSPFRIRTPSGDVTVLGTRFDLEAGGEDLRVVVLQGRVALSKGAERREVKAGEMGRIVNGTLPVVAQVPEIDRLVDWKGNFLAFQATPLREAAREIERQFGVRLVIADSGLGDRTITSWFAGWTVDEILEVVCGITHTRCVDRAGVVTITPEPDSGAPARGRR